MRFTIRHELKGRLRIHLSMRRMSFTQADTLAYYLQEQPNVLSVKVYERTADAVIRFEGKRDQILTILCNTKLNEIEAPQSYLENSSRSTEAAYYDRLISQVVMNYGRRLLLPEPVWVAWTILKSSRFLLRALDTIRRRKIEVPLLDGIAIAASILTGDYSTASSVMFLLDVGDTIEEWTHKKSVDDLARRMSLNISTVWIKRDDEEVQVDASAVAEGDKVVVRMGNLIPFDGEVCRGEAMVNQAAMTGEALPVRKDEGKSVFAGTIVEEGEITVLVKKTSGTGRFDQIVRMIEDSEKLKSSLEGKAEHLADRLVPYTLGGAVLTYLLTGNISKAVSVLMVDYSCALKLAMPISVLSAIREAAHYNISVKGGRYLEEVADADTIVLDKTGTLTKVQPKVVDVVSFNGEDEDELLREAACLEEHFPHSIANAVVNAALEKGLKHDELHSKVEYIVAHGISTKIGEKSAIIGSYHFVFEDESITLPDGTQDKYESLPEEYSRLYYAKDGKLAAVILIEDPLRENVESVIRDLKEIGFVHTVMMTGDSENAARSIAQRINIDEYYSEVLPEDKAGYVERVKSEGRHVIMVGDGINDSPALSAADVGIAISDGTAIARQIADITIGADGLSELIRLRHLSEALMKRIRFNYRTIITFNSSLIILGLLGILSPAASALLHNTSTVVLGLKSMTNYLDGDKLHNGDEINVQNNS